MKKTVFSGIQPSGDATSGIMLGNYIGAIRNWVTLQAQHNCLFCIVDMHAITVSHNPEHLKEKTYQALALYLASGIDPDKSPIFVQSHVSAHAELAWILSCNTWMGELSRMTQFKDKSAKQKNISTGLFFYPVLMAADILLYQTHLVPVGNDQKQHIELTRDIAIRMNGLYGDLFTIPEPFIPPVGARIMSLQDPTAKMSKSDPIPNATVFLMDSNDTITKKIKRSVTDSGSEITLSDEKPGVKNLLQIQSAITGKTMEAIVESYAGKQYGHLKLETADIVISLIEPIREKALNLLKEKSALDAILQTGCAKAQPLANATLKKTKAALGFI